MIRYLKHHFASAAPLVALTGLIVGIAKLGWSTTQLASGDASGGLTATLGEGVDEFSLRLGDISSTLSSLVTNANTWIGIAALCATAISVVSAFRQISEWLNGPGDVGGMVRHAAQKATDAITPRITPVRWGIVHDNETGRPLPFARVSVLDSRGVVVASTVADTRGHYGFNVSPEQIHTHGGVGGVRAIKDGYHHHTHMHPVSAGHVAFRADIPMARFVGVEQSASESSRVGRMVRTAAFWTGVATIPVVYLAAPSPVSIGIVALFGFSVIVRAVGARR